MERSIENEWDGDREWKRESNHVENTAPAYSAQFDFSFETTRKNTITHMTTCECWKATAVFLGMCGQSVPMLSMPFRYIPIADKLPHHIRFALICQFSWIHSEFRPCSMDIECQPLSSSKKYYSCSSKWTLSSVHNLSNRFDSGHSIRCVNSTQRQCAYLSVIYGCIESELCVGYECLTHWSKWYDAQYHPVSVYQIAHTMISRYQYGAEWLLCHQHILVRQVRSSTRSSTYAFHDCFQSYQLCICR